MALEFFGLLLGGVGAPGLLSAPSVIVSLLALIIWSISWKGVALWRAARGKQKVWFVVLLILNTAGILDILYLVFFQKKR